VVVRGVVLRSCMRFALASSPRAYKQARHAHAPRGISVAGAARCSPVSTTSAAQAEEKREGGPAGNLNSVGSSKVQRLITRVTERLGASGTGNNGRAGARPQREEQRPFAERLAGLRGLKKRTTTELA
jgi:hypothetical protein